MKNYDVFRFVRRRSLGAFLLLAAILAPPAWTRAACADEWAHATSPTDNPETPGPDLYNYTRLDDGAWSRANRLAIQAFSVAAILERPVEKSRLAFHESHFPGRTAAESLLCRGPPLSFAS